MSLSCRAGPAPRCWPGSSAPIGSLGQRASNPGVPTPGDYATRLENAGFRVNSVALIPRPTPLPGDIIEYLETFGQSFLNVLSGTARDEYLKEVRIMLEPQLVNPDGVWVADYVRLRFSATKV